VIINDILAITCAVLLLISCIQNIRQKRHIKIVEADSDFFQEKRNLLSEELRYS